MKNLTTIDDGMDTMEILCTSLRWHYKSMPPLKPRYARIQSCPQSIWIPCNSANLSRTADGTDSREESSSGVVINVNGHNISPQSQMEGGDMFQELASGSDYILIHFTKLPDTVQEAALRELHVQFGQIIHPNSWLAKFQPTDLSAIRSLSFVVYANSYHGDLSLPPGYKSALLGQLQDPVEQAKLQEVIISLHPGAMAPEELRKLVVSEIGVSRDRLFLTLQGLSASLRAQEILKVAQLDHVAVVARRGIAGLHCHLVDSVVNLETARRMAQSYLSCPGGLTGKGQIICVADGGVNAAHPSFAGRVLKLDNRVDTRPGQAAAAGEDQSGHGTHVAGIALGRYDGIGSQKEIGLRGPSLKGIAPGAELISQKVMIWDPKVKDWCVRYWDKDFGLALLYLDPLHKYPNRADWVQDGQRIYPKHLQGGPEQWRAKIHNHSWGDMIFSLQANPGLLLGYTQEAAELDLITSMNPDLCVIRSAGNQGNDVDIQKEFSWTRGRIHGFASAKNVITVGACYNGHVGQDTQDDGRLPDGARSYRTSTAGHIPTSSSPGPTICAQGQTGHSRIIKPDLVAPGVDVYSARSRQEAFDRSCRKAPQDNPHFSFHMGTSMAAPVVTGGSALVSEGLAKMGVSNPSGALLKALLVNGSVDLSKGGRYLYDMNSKTQVEPLTEAPNDVQGFGMVYLGASLKNITDTKRGLTGFVDAGFDPRFPDPTHNLGPINLPGLPGSVKRYRLWIPALRGKKAHLKATLAFNDYPGKGVQNQLALSIEFEDATIAKAKNTSVRDAGDALKNRMYHNNVQKLVVCDVPRPRDFPWTRAYVVVTSITIAANPFVSPAITFWTGPIQTPLSFAVAWQVEYI